MPTSSSKRCSCPLFIGAACALLAGLLLIFNSALAWRISEHLNRWVSSRAALGPLLKKYSIDEPLYRVHRLIGLLIAAGALYSLVILGSSQGETAILVSLGGPGSAPFNSWIAKSLRFTLLAGNFGGLIFGLLLMVRPSALKKFEAWADRKIFGPEAINRLEKMYLPADAFVRVHPRVVGGLVILGSVYVLANLRYVLLG